MHSKGPATEINPELSSPKTQASTPSFTSFTGKRGVLKNRFELIEKLGAGGMGEVYRAKDIVRERMEDSSPYVALKLLKGTLSRERAATLALQREAKKTQTLSHPNIVTVYDFDIDDDTAFITMEYLPGKSVHDYLREHQQIPPKRALKLIEHAARGLAYAHQEGFVHADIKPSNLYLPESGTIKLLDFGIAQAFRDAEEHRNKQEPFTENAMTPAYASPQVRAGQRPLPCDDVYSLAVVAYIMMTGRHPFSDRQDKASDKQPTLTRSNTPAPIKSLSRRHWRALQKALAIDSNKRFADAGEFIDAIKPRKLKKDILLLLTAGMITTAFILSTQFGLEQVTPTIDGLPDTMAPIKETLFEADTLLNNGDIAMAHQLYAQVKMNLDENYQAVTSPYQTALEILLDRRRKLVRKLGEKSKQSNLNQFERQEIKMALEFLINDDLTQDKRYVKKLIKQINQKLRKTQ